MQRLLIFLCCFGCSTAVAQLSPEIAELPAEVSAETTRLNSEYVVFDLNDAKSKKQVPLIIYLHGAGGKGKAIQKITGQAGRVVKSAEKFVTEPYLVAAPQSDGIWLAEDLDIWLAHLKTTLPVDPARIYLTGNSMGGYGTWVWSQHAPDQFAAIAPVVGGLGEGGPKDITPDLEKWASNLAKTPVWAFHGATDRVVPADRSEQMIDLIRKAGNEKAKLTVYPDMGHNAGRRVFEDPEFYAWLFAQKRKKEN